MRGGTNLTAFLASFAFDILRFSALEPLSLQGNLASSSSTAQADRPKKADRRHFGPGGILDWVQVN